MSNPISSPGFDGAAQPCFRSNHIQAASSEAACPIAALPNELLYSILQFLPRQGLESTALTCRNFSDLATDVLAEIEAKNKKLCLQLEQAGMTKAETCD